LIKRKIGQQHPGLKSSLLIGELETITHEARAETASWCPYYIKYAQCHGHTDPEELSDLGGHIWKK
jgi:hypothetical protein